MGKILSYVELDSTSLEREEWRWVNASLWTERRTVSSSSSIRREACECYIHVTLKSTSWQGECYTTFYCKRLPVVILYSRLKAQVNKVEVDVKDDNLTFSIIFCQTCRHSMIIMMANRMTIMATKQPIRIRVLLSSVLWVGSSPAEYLAWKRWYKIFIFHRFKCSMWSVLCKRTSF